MARGVKKIAAFLLMVLLIITCCGFVPGYNPESYSTDKILQIIRQLSSKDFNGRMAGTPDGKKTEEYIAARFKEIGLKPGGDKSTYFQEFSGVSGNPSGRYVLEVYDGDKVVKTYKYGEDYTSAPNLSYSGEITGRGAELSIGSGNIEKAGCEIALLKDFSKYNRLKDICDAGYKGVIMLDRTAITRKKGQSGVEDTTVVSKLPRVYVSRDVYNELSDYCGRGYNIHIKAAYEVKRFTARNVIGILKPKKPSGKYLVVSAHMDHLGPDPDGAYFPGALDNASGTACMIETARAIMSQKAKPDVNVVFIAFSGEEEMLFGSRYYVQNPEYPLKDTRVINLDMVGAKSSIPLTIMKDGSGHRGDYETDIIDEFETKAKGMGAQYEVSSGSGSDHSPFARAGVPAVTLIDYEKVVYHVPEDTIDNIGVDNLKRVMNITMEAIGEEVYYKGGNGSTQYIWIYVSGGVIIIAAAGFIIYRRKSAA